MRSHHSKTLALALVLLFPLLSLGDESQSVYLTGSADPTGACTTAGGLFVNHVNGKRFYCNGTVWVEITGGSGAPTDATYITQTANAALSAEQAMGALGTGIVINTTTTGVQSIYAGASCTNQFPRSLSASGAATCASVADADLASSYSGVGVCGANTWASTLNDNAAPTCTQPAFSNLSGAATDAQVPNNITIDLATTATTANAGDSATAFFSAGTIEVARGGTGAAPGADDQVLVADSISAATWRAVPDCVDSGGNHLNYTASTNTFSCGTSGGAGGGAALTRIAGSSGAAGPDITWQRLSANCTANATTTLAVCMTTTSVGAGTWKFKYTIIAQSSVTTTGFKFAVNHTGTTGAFVSEWRQVSTIGTATDGIADQVTSIAIGGAVAGHAERVKDTATIASVGVDTINADTMTILEGIIVVTASGSLELKHASETANSTQVMANTVLELHKIG